MIFDKKSYLKYFLKYYFYTLITTLEHLNEKKPFI
jgi:hypothetical protein